MPETTPKTKKAIIAALGSVLVVAGGATADLTTTSVREIEDSQEELKLLEGQFVHIPKKEVPNLIGPRVGMQVDEYLHPDGSRGYAIFLTRERSGKFEKRIISHDVDIEDRGWFEISSEAAPTSTPEVIRDPIEIPPKSTSTRATST